jgi:uncharacterized protein with HEPN domain
VNERDALRLRHILDAAKRIATFIEGADQSAFLSNPMMQDAVIRNRLVHGYFDVDLRIVWQTATDSIPAFARQIRQLVEAGR